MSKAEQKARQAFDSSGILTKEKCITIAAELVKQTEKETLRRCAALRISVKDLTYIKGTDLFKNGLTRGVKAYRKAIRKLE